MKRIEKVLPVTFDRIKEIDILEICSWVRSENQLRMISGDTADGLNEKSLSTWCSRSVEALTIRHKDSAVGFCTLSESEFDCPPGHVELCHFIVDPDCRRRYFGAAFLSYIRLIAAHRKYRVLHGRVVPENEAGMAFASYVNWKPDTSSFLDPRFNWFSYELRPISRSIE